MEAIKPATALQVDALQDDNGVVQRHTDGKRDAGQRNHVNGATHQEQANESRDGAYGDADDADERRLKRSQEQEHHERREACANREIGPNVLDRGFDVDHVVRSQLHLHAGRFEHIAVDLRDFGQHILLDVNNVGAGFAPDP